ncbi:MAG: peptidoglycan DD-metalloendopeptidase family protein [candidate division KSB1 bacterium]|nr:peptidoglycan DD-metalloendopeptidase family protein [candidate division KSB1 bacterium]MDZ7385557.1 peptidoglycan DD-metalloendopeptidase family protein [candidate division KSB1 bacterium]
MWGAKRTRALRFALWLLVGWVAVVAAQATDEQQQELRRVRAEVERYRAQLAQKEKRESALLDMLASLDREIALTRGVLQSLERQERRTQESITRLEREATRTEWEATRIRDNLRARILHYYKYGRTKDLELFLRSRSLTQARAWLRLQKRLAEADRARLRNLAAKREDLALQQALLRQQKEEQARLLAEKRREQENLRASRSTRGKLLAEVRSDKKQLQRRLQEYQQAAQRIEKMISAVEEKRLASPPAQITTYRGLAAQKGRLPWPTPGRVVGRYGRNKHPQLGTITQNIGVDIEGREGAPVRCVANGRVAVITWQRGGGNIVIVEHGEGYYTVYARLGEIHVVQQENVEAGQPIGTVGEEGVMGGAVLHFEVWKGTQHFNPLDWLSPSPR